MVVVNKKQCLSILMVHLYIYNRSNPGKPGYSIVNDFGNCFYNCRSIEGYDSIPSGWK